MPYSQFLCPRAEFDIDYTVICGQTFRWRRDRAGWWACLLPRTDPETGVMQHHLVRMWQDGEMVFYETTPKAHDLGLVRDYFRLDVDLSHLVQRFRSDPQMDEAMQEFAGLRLIRQDPVECLFSFLCSSAAPLYRIRRTLAAMCKEYGDNYPGGEVGGLVHHAFPPMHRLAESSIPHLTNTGLGYRARYIKETAQKVLDNGGAGWLFSLRQRSYPAAKAALMTLPGVGEKIADCVCLFSLDKDEAIPVDTHIRRIVQQTYLRGMPVTKSLTRADYARIGDFLRERFGRMAGWAQQYLFFHDLYEQGAWDAYTALYQPLVEPIRPLKK